MAKQNGNTEHTPGPWYYTGSSPEGSVYAADTHELIVPWSPLLGDRKMANARLIAAAPEMLALLREFVRPLYPPSHVRAVASALLEQIDGGTR